MSSSEKKQNEREIIYYRDELNDEFSTAQIEAKKIDGSWKYIRNRALSFFWYRIVATPIAFFYTKIKYRHRIVGREKLKDFKKQGRYLEIRSFLRLYAFPKKRI